MANRWDIEEETLLADMWQVVHEFHAGEGPFWQVVTERFNEQAVGPHRSKSQITSKWAWMNSECQQFHAIHDNLQPTRDPWVRVEDAMNVFKERNDGKAFKYFHVWSILRFNPTWCRFMG